MQKYISANAGGPSLLGTRSYIESQQLKHQAVPWLLCLTCFSYSWGRWTDILSHGRYKRQLTEQDVETICRTILVYCLNHYKGDENIKSFIWDLITPTADGQTRALVNHSGMSTQSNNVASKYKGIVSVVLCI